MKLEIEFCQEDVTDLLGAAAAINDSWHSQYLRILAAEIESKLAQPELEMTLPGPDGEPNEYVPVSSFENLTRSWDVV